MAKYCSPWELIAKLGVPLDNIVPYKLYFIPFVIAAESKSNERIVFTF